MRSSFRPFLLSLLAVVSVLTQRGEARAAATIRLINRDAPGEGFNDRTPAEPVGGNAGTTLGAQRQIAFQRAIDIWADVVESSVEIRVGATFDRLDCSNTSVVLGFAGPNNVYRDFAGAPRPNTFYGDALADSLAGVDLCPPESCDDSDDIGAAFNTVLGAPSCPFPAWYMGLDGQTPDGTPDLVTTVLHELGHGLGFLTFIDARTGQRFMNGDDAYMVYLENHLTRKLFPDMTDAERAEASRETGNLHWVGPAVVAASGRLEAGVLPSGHVEMYAPFSFSPGASVSHFSNELFPNELMEPFDTGPILDVGLTRELFLDLGWGVSGIPPTRTPTPGPTRTSTLRPTVTRRPTSTRPSTPTRTLMPTGTRTSTRTVTGTPPTATPTVTRVPPDTCLGDCDGSGSVSVDELVMGVRIALGVMPIDRCGAFDVAFDGTVSIDDLVTAVDHSLGACP